MQKVLLYSFLLLIGMGIAQFFNLDSARPFLIPLTMVCLSYIMLEVGLEFTLDKTKLSSYGTDYLIAATAASLPWLLCSFYLYFTLSTSIADSLLVGCFAAPTSAGVLFAMLSAVGLSHTWLFQKARVLAIFDDLHTILLLIPLQMLFVGFKPQIILLLIIIGFLLWIAYRYLHQLHLPATTGWLFTYAISMVIACKLFEALFNTHLEVLLPAFCLGCVIKQPHAEEVYPDTYTTSLKEKLWQLFDLLLKGLFMLLVGMSIPKVVLNGSSYWILAVHVLLLTLLSNLGKMFPALCYQEEAALRERFALSIAMFPRGEVGAGVLMIAISYGLRPDLISISGLSLALNLILTGFFIAAVIKLLKIAPTRGS